MQYITVIIGGRECGLVIGEASIGVLHNQPIDICMSDTGNQFVVDRKYLLNFIYIYIYIEISLSNPVISAVLSR